MFNKYVNFFYSLEFARKGNVDAFFNISVLLIDTYLY